ncbi:hypothetical protein IFT63_08870 [Stenotrophomonas sp. CFBP 13724]|uniref:hypothetical protein n=1 Tax=Stenotrophomonas sp. CFBP 13724 TaxID=2775298 RepID=UPI0017828C45|nr:hypothetical protein [Stenotrophomonas sp. CFBP 13724]MBD8643700.1 hypothetical protein [Stenotrophomonas sp. CFBP 13724]
MEESSSRHPYDHSDPYARLKNIERLERELLEEEAVSAVLLRKRNLLIRVFIGISVLLVMAALLIYSNFGQDRLLTENQISRLLQRDVPWKLLAAMMTIAGMSVAVGAVTGYLDKSDGARARAFPPLTPSDELKKLRKIVTRLQARMDAKQGESAPTSKDELLDETARQKVIDELSAKITGELSDKARHASHIANIRRLHEASSSRLFAEIVKLNQRAKLNLAIGIVITVVAAMILFYIAASESPKNTTLASLAAHYVPRLSTVIFVEVFAFFFLRLYKSALQDIRAYQQDMSRLSSEAAATELFLFCDDDKDRAVIAGALTSSGYRDLRPQSEATTQIDAKLLGELATIIARISGTQRG